MKKYFFLGPVAAAVVWLLITPACRQQPQTRQYEEKDTAVALAPVQPQVQPRSKFWRWEKPLHWQEEKGVNLRLVTFSISERDSSGQCILISLPGDGGGVEANVQRWLEQLHLPPFSPSEAADFLSRQKKMQTRNDLSFTVIDFTTLNHPQKQVDPSLLVAIVPGENETLFVKMGGEKALLEKNREVFYKFCQSLSLGA